MNSRFHISLKRIQVNGRKITIYLNIVGKLQVDYGEVVIDRFGHRASQSFSIKPIVTTTSKTVRLLIVLSHFLCRLKLASAIHVTHSR